MEGSPSLGVIISDTSQEESQSKVQTSEEEFSVDEDEKVAELQDSNLPEASGPNLQAVHKVWALAGPRNRFEALLGRPY